MKHLFAYMFVGGFIFGLLVSPACQTDKTETESVNVNADVFGNPLPPPTVAAPAPTNSGPPEIVKIVWSHYTGWEPWELARQQGILTRWGQKYNVAIELTLASYVESLTMYTNGQYDGVVATNMDALMTPGVGGKDSTVLIMGDFSNGNDGIVARGITTGIAGLRGRRINLVQYSVSHYLLSRLLSMNGMTDRDVTVVSTDEASIVPLFSSNNDAIVVTWNPMLLNCRTSVQGGATLLENADSRQIPGEIMDLLIVRSDLSDAAKRALTGAWYETMALMSGRGPATDTAIRYMANFAGGTEAEFRAQLATTRMFYTAIEAADFTAGAKVKETMEFVRTFLADNGQLGQGHDKNFVGIQFPDNTIIGNANNVKLRFNASFMRMAANNQL